MCELYYLNLGTGPSSLTYYNYYWVTGMGIHHVTGKQHNQWFGTGIGLGFVGDGKIFFSVYGECRGYMLAERFSPYYSVSLGYGISASSKINGIKEMTGGLFFNPSLGYRFGGSANANFVLSLGYKLQVAKFTERPGNGVLFTQSNNFNIINTTFGLLF